MLAIKKAELLYERERINAACYFVFVSGSCLMNYGKIFVEILLISPI